MCTYLMDPVHWHGWQIYESSICSGVKTTSSYPMESKSTGNFSKQMRQTDSLELRTIWFLELLAYKNLSLSHYFFTILLAAS